MSARQQLTAGGEIGLNDSYSPVAPSRKDRRIIIHESDDEQIADFESEPQDLSLNFESIQEDGRPSNRSITTRFTIENAEKARKDLLATENDPNAVFPDGIRYRMREVNSRGDFVREYDANHPMKKSYQDASLPYWLKVIDFMSSRNGEVLPRRREVVICDSALRDFIADKVIPSFIDHTGKQLWQQEEVVLKPKGGFLTILLNYTQLQKAADGILESDIPENISKQITILLQIISSRTHPGLLRAMNSLSSDRDFRIAFEQIWVLFKPGNLVISSWNHAEDLQVFKIHLVAYKPDYVSVIAWIWDWDGQRLVRSAFEFRIERYDDDKRPAELACYPMEFWEEITREGAKQEILNKSALRRKLFFRYTYHQSSTPDLLQYRGDIISGYSSSSLDDVIYRSGRPIDFFESKRPISSRLRVHKVDEDIVLDTQNYIRRSGGIHWLGSLEPHSGTLCSCTLCLSQESKEWAKALQEGKPFDRTDDDLLLPPRISGYSLGRKEWCQFSLPSISVIQDQWAGSSNSQSIAKGLILPDELTEQEQEDISSMVASHSRVMARPIEKRIGDIIGGKGESLILLFHGHSGTGKTLYAEWLAKSSHRPLFKVGTSEIGLDPAEAERNLKEIFELAESWSAILLIDEADVLLDARGGANEGLMSKNALVSVLLREVEYFKGIIIMTTNRVRAFDPAILSRIHHAVNFEETSQRQERKIWDSWVGRIEERALTREPDQIKQWVQTITSRKGRNVLSGREIRNVFIQAQTMAEEKGRDINVTRDHLDRAYEYRQSFRKFTEQQRWESKNLHAQIPSSNG